jgi:endoglucanase
VFPWLKTFSDEWIAQFVRALEKNNIGWAFWPYKKMEKSSAVVSIIPPADWGKIVEFAKLPRGTAHVEERLKARPEPETPVLSPICWRTSVCKSVG